MELTTAQLKEKILNAYYNNGIQPQIVSNIKNIKTKPCLAYRVSDVLDIDDKTLSIKNSLSSNLEKDFTINENSIIVLDFFRSRNVDSAMNEFKGEKTIEFFTEISDFDIYKPCDEKGYYADDEVIKKTKQTRERYEKNLAGKDVTFVLSSKPSTEMGFNTDYFLKVINNDGKQVANCVFNVLNKKYCNLGWIEIEDENYIKIGLGSEMLKVAEKVAVEKGAFHISARIQPFGQFASRTNDFYTKNGFTVEYDPMDRKVYGNKKLKELENEDETELE